MDILAERINHYYNDPNGSVKEQWMNCSYFNRMSCRASADFLFPYISGLNICSLKELGSEKLENMAKTEHKRWNAFHFSMGYSTMNQKIWEQRAREYLEEKSEKGASKLRISKDTENMLHACLISWDELDGLSAREQKVTGHNIDYKQMDRDNVRTVIELLETN